MKSVVGKLLLLAAVCGSIYALYRVKSQCQCEVCVCCEACSSDSECICEDCSCSECCLKK